MMAQQTAECEDSGEDKTEEKHSRIEPKELSRGDRIRGAYENKIRFFSPPEKVFEIFSHEKNENGKLEMSQSDFLVCVTPFNKVNFDQEAEEYLKTHDMRGVFDIIDADHSGTISYTEFSFFLTLTQMPMNQVRRRFKKSDPKNSITRDEFAALIRDMSKKSFKKKQDAVKLDARLV